MEPIGLRIPKSEVKQNIGPILLSLLLTQEKYVTRWLKIGNLCIFYWEPERERLLSSFTISFIIFFLIEGPLEPAGTISQRVKLEVQYKWK